MNEHKKGRESRNTQRKKAKMRAEAAIRIGQASGNAKHQATRRRMAITSIKPAA